MTNQVGIKRKLELPCLSKFGNIKSGLWTRDMHGPMMCGRKADLPPKNSSGRQDKTRVAGVHNTWSLLLQNCRCILLLLMEWSGFAGGPVLACCPATAELAEPPPVRGGLLLAYFAQPQFPADAAASAGLPPTAGPEDQAALLQGERVGERRRCNRALCWVVE